MTFRLRNWDYTQRTIYMITCTLADRAAGRLLMLAPAVWPCQPGEKAMTHDDATAMNRLCQWLADAMENEINYHGVCPENVDGLVCRTVRITKPD